MPGYQFHKAGEQDNVQPILHDAINQMLDAAGESANPAARLSMSNRLSDELFAKTGQRAFTAEELKTALATIDLEGLGATQSMFARLKQIVQPEKTVAPRTDIQEIRPEGNKDYKKLLDYNKDNVKASVKKQAKIDKNMVDIDSLYAPDTEDYDIER